jgi:hypothetical protein
MGTNVPQIQWLPTGLVIPTQAAILAGAQADIQAVFSGKLNFVNQSTPQSQLAASLATIVSQCYAALAYFVNQVNPSFASGFMQDALAQIYFLTREAGVPTAVEVQCIGLQGTVIPAGFKGLDTSGNVYICTQSGTIPNSGTITLEFANVVNGPIACPANTLNQIYQALPGLDRINNTLDGEEGAYVETQQEFELRRIASVAANGQGSLPSVYGAVFDIPDVIDVYCTENDTNVPVTVGSTAYSLLPNSIYVGVVGGAAAAIAQAIYTKKSPGCNMNGNTTQTVTDTSGYQEPFPTYTITFNIPTPTPILFAIQIKNAPNVPANIVALGQSAIIAQFTGANGAPRARIASLLVATQYVACILAVAPNLSLLSVLMGIGTANANSVQMGIDQAPTIAAGNISVTLV